MPLLRAGKRESRLFEAAQFVLVALLAVFLVFTYWIIIFRIKR